MLNTLESLQRQASKKNAAKLGMVMATVKDWESCSISVRILSLFLESLWVHSNRNGKLEVVDDVFLGYGLCKND